MTIRIVLAWCVIAIFSANLNAQQLVDAVKRVKPSVVGVGVYEPLGSPRAILQGSGFAVADGYHIITNYHVVATPLDEKTKQQRVIFVGTGSRPKTLTAQIVAKDELHDLAVLKVTERQPTVELAPTNYIDDGTEIAFTGFPIGMVLGLYPATHRGIIAATTPVILPTMHSSQLDQNTLRRLRDPYFVYQLDATAYPGNSGSMVYAIKDAKVVGVINKVFVKTTKEAVLSDPSGITYAIPVKYVRNLLAEAGVEVK